MDDPFEFVVPGEKLTHDAVGVAESGEPSRVDQVFGGSLFAPRLYFDVILVGAGAAKVRLWRHNGIKNAWVKGKLFEIEAGGQSLVANVGHSTVALVLEEIGADTTASITGYRSA